MTPRMRVRTMRALGARNLSRNAAYRIMCKSGYFRRTMPVRKLPNGPFFDWSNATPTRPDGIDREAHGKAAAAVRSGEHRLFAGAPTTIGFPPDWRHSALNGSRSDSGAHWTLAGEHAVTGDIKGLWDVSRFDGLLQLSLGWLCTGDPALSGAIEEWMASWCAANDANSGVQWSCGQETGLRVMTFLLASQLLRRWGGVEPTPAAEEFVQRHLERIRPTMLYAVSQDNNHATSESAALVIGGAWLQRSPNTSLRAEGRRWERYGRKVLEERVGRLVMDDGSFSQHSVIYQRMLLDTLWLTEIWHGWFDQPRFSEHYYARFRLATEWLRAFVDPESFDAPNLGANDGTCLFRLTPLPYRDFRPTLLLADAALGSATTIDRSDADAALAWLGLDRPGIANREEPGLKYFPNGGYVRLTDHGTRAFLRLPVFRFRPSQCDALHVELWRDGRAVLRDGGSYSYNAALPENEYFAGVRSHNTVQFDGRDQMPRQSRFLYTSWLQMKHFALGPGSVTAGYTDSEGASHRRTMELRNDSLAIDDEIGGRFQLALLRWRLDPARTWTLQGNECTDGETTITVDSTAAITGIELATGWESLVYNEKSEIPELHVALSGAQTVRTVVSWRS